MGREEGDVVFDKSEICCQSLQIFNVKVELEEITWARVICRCERIEGAH